MLDDFAKTSSAGSRRLGASLIASMGLYAAAGAGVVAASSVVRHVVQEDDLVQVAFAPPPPPVVEPSPPPPADAAPAQGAAPARLGRPRPRVEAPRELPLEAPRPSSATPAPPDDPFAPENEGSPSGSALGSGVGTGGSGSGSTRASAGLPERSAGPVRVIDGTRSARFDRSALQTALAIPDALRSAGLSRVTIVVRVSVAEDGRVTQVEVLRGHPLLPDDNVRQAYLTTRAEEPCRMLDGSPYACVITQPFTLAFTI